MLVRLLLRWRCQEIADIGFFLVGGRLLLRFLGVGYIGVFNLLLLLLLSGDVLSLIVEEGLVVLLEFIQQRDWLHYLWLLLLL